MAYNIRYSDYPTSAGPPDPLRWVGPPGPPGPVGPVGPPGTEAIVYTADTPPAGDPGTLWWDSAGTGLYINYNDGNSTQWVVAQNQNALSDAPSDANTYGRHAGTWISIGLGTSVKGFGAKGDGVSNDTTAFTNALAVARGTTNIVTVPSGLYLIDPITIPAGVTLQGDVPGPLDPQPGFLTTPIGATLLVNSHGSAFITLNLSSQLSDVVIHDPGQVAPTATAPNVFPAQVVMAQSSRVRRITICNAYDGIKVTTGRSYVEDCYIGAYHTCIAADTVQDVLYYNNVWCGPFYDTSLGLGPWQNMDAWVMNNNGVAFMFGRADAVSMVGCGCFVKWAGIYIVDGTPAGGSYGWCVNCNLDVVSFGVVANSCNALGWTFTNLVVLPNGDARWQSQAPVFLTPGGANAPVIRWTAGTNGVTSFWLYPNGLVQAGTLYVNGVNNIPNTPITLAADPAAPMQAVTKQYTDKMLPMTGGTMVGQLTLASGQPLRLTDASGGAATGIVLQSDNNLVIAGSGSTGAARNIAAMGQRSDTSTFNWLVPVTHNAPTTFGVGPLLPNGVLQQFTDTSGSNVLLGMQADNALYLIGTNATGAQRIIMGMAQRSSTSVMGLQVPVQFVSTVGFNNTAPIAKPTLAGAWAGNAAGKALATILASYGLLTDNSTA